MKTAIFCNTKIDGGGEQSAANIAKMLNADLISLSDDGWKASGREHQKQVWYMNDKVYELAKDTDLSWTRVLSEAKEIYIVLNFTMGGLQDCDWLQYYNVKRIIFLNETKRNEFIKKRHRALENIPTTSLAPCVDINPYLNIKKAAHGGVNIGRHSRISLKYPPSPCQIYDKLIQLNNNGVNFKFMLAHKEIVAKYSGDKRFKFFEWNKPSVAEFLSDVDIMLYIISPKCNDQGPRVVVEAMAAGIPVVTENRDGMKDRINSGVTGFLVENEAEAILKTQALINDKELRDKMGNAAREYAREYFKPERWAEVLSCGSQ